MGAKKTIVIHEEDSAHISDGKLTAPVIIICIVVAFAGLIFGYQTGVYGDILKMRPFLDEFFPSLLRSLRNNGKQDPFCGFYSWNFRAYASSLYIAGILAALLGGRLTTSAGRKVGLIIGGMIYLIGIIVQALAVKFEMLIMGRMLSGFGIGFTNQAAPLYLVEMAPTKWRGAIATVLPLFFEIGVASSRWISLYLIKQYPNDNLCWRISLGLAALPAIILTILAFFIPDTPTSLIQRGKVQEALRSLNQVRSTDVDIENELNYLINYHEAMRNASEKPYQLLFGSKYRPQLLLVVALPAFRQLTGIHLIVILVPILFRFLGFDSKQILFSLYVKGAVAILSVILAIYLIDRVGRRMLLLQGGIQIFICQLVLAIIIASELDKSSAHSFSNSSAITGLFLAAVVNAGFSWSWGTVNWILPSELLPTEVRAAGQGLFVAFNFAFQYLSVQTVSPMLCNFKYAAFLFYAGWDIIMTIFVILFVPETKRIPLESMDIIWRNHWYWNRFVRGTSILLMQEIDDQ